MTDRDEHRAFVERRWPGLDVRSFEPIGDGWDCFTYLVNGEWVFQLPRLEDAPERLRRQIVLLPELARELSSRVPVPAFVSEDPVCLGYGWIEGSPLSGAVDGIWPERLGRFLYDLHLVPPEYVGMRTTAPSVVGEAQRMGIGALRRHVLPLLTSRERARAERSIDSFFEDDDNFRFSTCLSHGDIGPAHVLVTAKGDLAGVIDWGDTDVGDPAWDLAWILHAMPDAGERALGAYGGAPDARFRDRARFLYTMMPWHEVKHGALTGQPRFIESGLAGVRDRLG